MISGFLSGFKSLKNKPLSSCGTAILPLVHSWFIGSQLLFYFVFPIVEKYSGDKLFKVSETIPVCHLLLKCSLYIFVGTGTFVYKLVSVSTLDCLFGGVARISYKKVIIILRKFIS